MNEPQQARTPPASAVRPRGRRRGRAHCGSDRARGLARGGAQAWVLAALVLLAAAALGAWQWHRAEAADLAVSDAASGAASAGAASNPASNPQGTGRRRFGGANPVQPVSVASVRRQAMRVTLNAIGSMAASNTAVVRPQVSGVLLALNFSEGQQVQAGQLLARIEPRAFEAALSQAEGTLARDQAQLDNARIDLERYRGLLAKDAIPKQQLDTQAALVRQLDGTVKADRGTLDSARLQLSYTRVTAPIAGRVGLKQADLGNAVQPSDANGIVSITQTRPIALVFAVPAAHVPRIAARLRSGATIPVEAWDRAGKTRLAVGAVASIDNAIDASTDTIKVKALFPNADDALFPNQAVAVVLQLDTLSGVLAVPQAAVLRGAQGFYVYAVGADSTVATRVVKPGAVDDGWIAVDGALQPGDTVVIDGTDRLREGAKVEVIAADPQQRAGANAAPGAGRRGPRNATAAGSAASGVSGGAGSGPAGKAGSTPADGAAARPGSAASAALDAAAERPRWMDRVTPEQAEKLKAMAPDERRAWLRAQRDARSTAPAP
jgi:multidrug efflux system membrane fusion protein